MELALNLGTHRARFFGDRGSHSSGSDPLLVFVLFGQCLIIAASRCASFSMDWSS